MLLVRVLNQPSILAIRVQISVLHLTVINLLFIMFVFLGDIKSKLQPIVDELNKNLKDLPLLTGKTIKHIKLLYI